MSDETAPPPSIKVTWLIATFLGFAIFLVIGAYSKRMTNHYADYDKQRAKQRYDTLAKVQAAENALIEPADKQGNVTAQWVDETKGTIRIPIEEAMAREVDDLKAQAPAMGNALPVPAPAAAPVPAASTTNAAPAAPAAPATNAPAGKAPAAPASPTPPASHAKPTAEKKPAPPPTH